MSTPTPTTPKTANSESSSSSSVESNSGVGGERDDRIRIVLSPPADHLTATITNVVCSFATKCHLNLRRIATRGMHVEFKKENNMVSMKLRKPQTTASMWSSGKCTCTGAQSERDAYRAARRFCRLLQKLNFKVRLSNYRVVNVLATCVVPFHIDVIRLAEQYRAECSYEPELHPGATFKVNEFRATLKLFSTGSITLTAPSVAAIKRALEYIYPILLKFKFNTTEPTETPPPLPTTTTSTIKTEQTTTSTTSPITNNSPLNNHSITLNSTQNTTQILKSNNLNLNNNHHQVTLSTTTLPYNLFKPTDTNLEFTNNNNNNTTTINTPLVHNNHLHQLDSQQQQQQTPQLYHHHSTTIYHHHHGPTNGVTANPFAVVDSPWTSHLNGNSFGVAFASNGYGSHTGTGVVNATNPGASHAAHHWFNDSLLIDNVLDDFLP